MTDATPHREAAAGPYRARNKIRFVTAAALFDGHDAAINVFRRILQASGAEVIHLGHSRAVEEIVRAAIQEDVQGIAVSSYQGGHVEYFRYMVDLLRQRGAGHIKVFGGGGGVIVPEEIRALEEYGVARIYAPEHGRRLGLQGIVDEMLALTDTDLTEDQPADLGNLGADDGAVIARLITAAELDRLPPARRMELRRLAAERAAVPVLGITGTGGAGKSSLTDELVRRFLLDGEDRRIAILSVDPTRRKTGGALLGDRIRMNAISHPGVYMRSLATRVGRGEVSPALPAAIEACKAAGFDLVIVETAGIGQGDAGIVPLVDASLYVMTPEFGAPSQLEKIDMLDFADLVAINKFDRRGGADALRDVRKQVQRNHAAFATPPERMPVYGTIAARFNDPGTTALYHGVRRLLEAKTGRAWPSRLAEPAEPFTADRATLIPAGRQRYLADIAACARDYRRRAERQAAIARERQSLDEAARMVGEAGGDPAPLRALEAARSAALDTDARALLDGWPALRAAYGGETLSYRVRGNERKAPLVFTTLSGTRLSRIFVPGFADQGEVLRWLMLENVPGRFPFTAGVFPLKRPEEMPTRMFAGEGDAFRTNRRFKLLSAGQPAKRLSTAFDSVTLYGEDPDERPDIYGKVGNSGVSIATLDDMKALYDGFDLCDPATSVSMTINGPAPTILAMFLNTAIDQKRDAFARAQGRAPGAAEDAAIRAQVLATVRGTVQADILKEDQGQNTCIFSTEFSLKVMGDIQEYFIANNVRNFYSVSISGYHIAEAGANPISQLAFTLANGFTFVEAYLARGMAVDDFAPNFSFFFSNGMDPEYSVIGRVARRIWSVVMRERYGAGERAQQLKYHVQTSGRSLHAQEIDFNDIRTTLQALIAIYDNCNSLHTNAFDEAITTPTEASVRRALAIQMIVNREWGPARIENVNQGAFAFEALTDLVEEAVLAEFERIAERGGVLGAMETGYQRGKIQDESLHYEMLKHTGELPIVGVNTFVAPEERSAPGAIPLARSTEAEKRSQIERLRAFQAHHADAAPAALAALGRAATSGENVFASLMDAVRCCSLGQITHALYEVGGQYRRNM